MTRTDSPASPAARPSSPARASQGTSQGASQGVSQGTSQGASGKRADGTRFGALVGIGLLELAVLLVLPLIAVFTHAWQTGLAAIIVMAVLLAALAAWQVLLLARSQERILHAPGVFCAVTSLAGLLWPAIALGRLTAYEGGRRVMWPMFGGPAKADPDTLRLQVEGAAASWLRVSLGVLAALLIAGFLYEMLRRDRSSLILSLGTILLLGTAGWCAGGWLFLPLMLAGCTTRIVLLFVVVIFVFALALLAGIRFVCAAPGSLPQDFVQSRERQTSLVCAVACLGLLGLMVPVLLVL